MTMILYANRSLRITPILRVAARQARRQLYDKEKAEGEARGRGAYDSAGVKAGVGSAGNEP
jgi:hypothetical protein